MSSDFYKVGIKISGRCVGFSWCTLICTILNDFWNTLTLTSGKELFWRVDKLFFCYPGMGKGNNGSKENIEKDMKEEETVVQESMLKACVTETAWL